MDGIEDDGSTLASVSVTAAAGTAVVAISGEIDLSNAAATEASIRAGLPGDARRIVFDLGELRFMDSSGLAVLLRLAGGVEAVAIRNASGAIVRIIEVTGLTETLPSDDG
ncbi:MAG: STAS domain-containing protein [Acidimicrobiia bacterium]